jgi:hypothetical protein
VNDHALNAWVVFLASRVDFARLLELWGAGDPKCIVHTTAGARNVDVEMLRLTKTRCRILTPAAAT